jgi:hypothetical protein
LGTDARKKPKDGSESHFASYLNKRGLRWEYEPKIGGKRPDFLVKYEPQKIVAEVYDPTLRLPKQSGPFTSYPALRKTFTRNKKKQIAAVKSAGLPYVCVIGRANSDMEIAAFLMAGAMFGDLAYTIPLSPDPSAPPPVGKTVYAQGGRVQPKQFRGVSAVAILKVFNPTLWRVEDAWDERLKESDIGASMTNEQLGKAVADRGKAMEEMTLHMIDTGDYLPDARLARLVVLHNPFAKRPLDMWALAGPHDEHWQGSNVNGELRYGPVWRGTLFRETGSGGRNP